MQAGQALIKAIGWREWDDAKKMVTEDTTGQLMSYVDNEGRNPVHRACSRGAPPDLMDVILAVCNEDILLSRDNNGLTPLHWAVSSSIDEVMISMVIEACPKATTVTDKAGRTPYDLAKGRKKSPAILQQLQNAVKVDELQSKGNAALMEGNTSKAIKYYSRCIDTYGASGVLHSNRSAAYLIGGDVQNALDDAERCLELLPNFGEGYTRKGSALRAYGMYDEAVAAFRDGLERCPNDPDLLSSLSDLEHEMCQREHEETNNEAEESNMQDETYEMEADQNVSQETVVGGTTVDTQMYTSEIARLQEEMANMEKNHEMNMNDLRDKMDEMEKKHEADVNQRISDLEKKYETELDEVRREAQESRNSREGEIADVKHEAEEAASGYMMEIEDIKREAEEALQLQETEMMTEIENLRNELQEVKEKNSELEESMRKVEEMKKRQEEGSEVEMKNLNEQIEELKSQVEEMKSEKESQSEELEELKTSTSIQVNKLRIDIEVLGEEKDTLEMELSDVQMKLASEEEKHKKVKETMSKIIGQAEAAAKSQQQLLETLRECGDVNVDTKSSPLVDSGFKEDGEELPVSSPVSTPSECSLEKLDDPDPTPRSNNLPSAEPTCVVPAATSFHKEDTNEKAVDSSDSSTSVCPDVDMQSGSKENKPDNNPRMNMRGRSGSSSRYTPNSHSKRGPSPSHRLRGPSPLRYQSGRPSGEGVRGRSPRVGGFLKSR